MKDLKTMTDEQLALAYVDGNDKAFDLLLQRNQQKIFSYILFVVHDQETANDVFQETFVKVITNLQMRRYSDTGKFTSWVMRIAHNIIMDWYRNNKLGNIIEPAQDNDLSNLSSADLLEGNKESQYVNEQVLKDVRSIMNLLPAPQREVVYMRFYQEMSFKEIAETTGVSINTSLGRMRYAIINMRRMAKAHDLSMII